jgi:vitamin K-dependent gamma-carboxylase
MEIEMAQPSTRVDAASLVLLRVFVGLLLFVSTVRFVARGWVDELLLAPSFHFHYWGFAWVAEPSPFAAYALFAGLCVASLMLAAGLCVRLSAGLSLLAFTYVELIDVTYYLNHYYFLSCLLALFVLLPPQPEADGRVSWIQLTLTRTQVALVYVYAGLAKLGSDWLLHAQPLKIWLSRHADLPIVGPWMDEPWLAHLASWAGAGFDLLVVPALLWRPTRPYAYAAVVGFHVITGLLFPIGMFPWFMIACATILLAPDWPRRFISPGSRLDRPRSRNHAALVGAAAVLLAIQLALPWRSLCYPGSVLWHEQGFRFSYRVMLVEKAGFVEFHVHDRTSGRRWTVDPRTELTALQIKMMSTQPDLIAQYARHVRARIEREQPESLVEVRVDAFVSLNGRPHHRLIDPAVDLAATRPGLAAQPWILPAPEVDPP